MRVFPADLAHTSKRYNTGDRGRRFSDRPFASVGHSDQEIALHEIEPAEVELALLALSPVNDAVVIVRDNELGALGSLVAYVALQADIRGLLPRHIQAMLAQRLPRYLVPEQIYLLDEMPRLPNLKIDRRAVARIGAVQAFNVIERREDSLLKEIVGIFETVMELKGATPEDTVASLGGDSLQELSVFVELERRYGVRISDDMINQRPAICSIASWIAGQKQATPRR